MLVTFTVIKEIHQFDKNDSYLQDLFSELLNKGHISGKIWTLQTDTGSTGEYPTRFWHLCILSNDLPQLNLNSEMPAYI